VSDVLPELAKNQLPLLVSHQQITAVASNHPALPGSRIVALFQPILVVSGQATSALFLDMLDTLFLTLCQSTFGYFEISLISAVRLKVKKD
jgi:hypothetical protein